MVSKILLVNFGTKEAEYLEKLGIGCHMGYLSNAYEVIRNDGKEKFFDFFFPLAIYEYKAVFIKLTGDPLLKNSLERKRAKTISGDDTLNFIKYWKKKGVLTIFLEDNNFDSLLKLLGIPFIGLTESSGKDITINFPMDDVDRPFRQIFKEVKSLIKIPPIKYIEVEQREEKYRRWQIINIYENLNDQALGVYFNDSPSYSDKDLPSFILLPQFKEYKEVIYKLVKSFAKIYKNFIPEIYESDWVDSNRYCPKEVLFFDEQIKKIQEEAKNKTEELTKAKSDAKKKYSFLRKILYETGDELKNSVIKVLSNVWKLKVEDMDLERKTDFREDILIKREKTIILGEIKGTQNSTPSFTYITQLLTHILKSKYKESTGALILNHDLKKDPEERLNAYTKEDEENQLKNIIFIDTRVLFELSIGILDYGLNLEMAKKYLFTNGRVTFDINNFLKEQLEKKVGK